MQCTGISFLKRTHCYLWSSKQTFRSSQTHHHEHSNQLETDLEKNQCKTNMSLQPHKQGMCVHLQETPMAPHVLTEPHITTQPPSITKENRKPITK